MSSSDTPTLTVNEVLRRIESELSAPSERSNALKARISQLRTLQREFRNEPIGGRLTPLKKLVYWFTASAFDRQGKVIEALFDLIDEMATEIDQLERLTVQLGKDHGSGASE